MLTFLAHAHMLDATQQDVSLGLAHMFDATQQDVSRGLAHMFDATEHWGGVGWGGDVNMCRSAFFFRIVRSLVNPFTLGESFHPFRVGGCGPV